MAITISTIDDLEDLVNGDLGTGDSSNYLEVILSADLDFNDLDDTDERKWNFRYSGAPSDLYINFDGGGHTIKNLNYSTAENDWSLFYRIAGSISNLTLSDVNIIANNAYGFIFGLAAKVTLTNCHILGFVSATSTAVGLSGYTGSSGGNLTARRCSFSGELTGGTVFGLVNGQGANASICYVTGNLRTTGGVINLINQSSSSATTTVNTFFKGNIYGSLTALRFATATVKYCYCMIFNATSISGQYGMFPSSAVKCFYNNDEYDYGTSAISGMGTDKDNLQNTAWLANEGWPS